MIGKNLIPKYEDIVVKEDYEAPSGSIPRSSPPQTKKILQDEKEPLQTERPKKSNKNDEIALGRFEKTIAGSAANK